MIIGYVRFIATSTDRIAKFHGVEYCSKKQVAGNSECLFLRPLREGNMLSRIQSLLNQLASFRQREISVLSETKIRIPKDTETQQNKWPQVGRCDSKIERIDWDLKKTCKNHKCILSWTKEDSRAAQ